jgi:hypothetical protein
MKLTTHELDELTELQFNFDPSELREAIDKLSDEQLVALRHDCLAGVKRQNDILARIQRRLSQN